jgi:hypothetical protein
MRGVMNEMCFEYNLCGRYFEYLVSVTKFGENWTATVKKTSPHYSVNDGSCYAKLFIRENLARSASNSSTMFLTIQDLQGNGDNTAHYNIGLGTTVFSCAMHIIQEFYSSIGMNKTIMVDGELSDVGDIDPISSHRRRCHFYKKFGMHIENDKDHQSDISARLALICATHPPRIALDEFWDANFSDSPPLVLNDLDRQLCNQINLDKIEKGLTIITEMSNQCESISLTRDVIERRNIASIFISVIISFAALTLVGVPLLYASMMSLALSFISRPLLSQNFSLKHQKKLRHFSSLQAASSTEFDKLSWYLADIDNKGQGLLYRIVNDSENAHLLTEFNHHFKKTTVSAIELKKAGAMAFYCQCLKTFNNPRSQPFVF